MELKSINLLTHNDLDGAACAIVAEYCATRLGLPCNVTMTSNFDLDKNFKLWREKMSCGVECSLNIISDLPIGNLAEDFMGLPTYELEHPRKSIGEVIRSNIIIDHHIDSMENPALQMVNYECEIELTDNSGVKCRTCGALLVWRYFTECFDLELDELYEFVNLVRDWDTHSYPATLNPLAEKYNLLYFQMGYDWFRDYILRRISDGASLACMEPTVKVLCDRMINTVRIETRKRIPSDRWDHVVIAGSDVLVQICDNKSLYSELGAAVSEQSQMIAMMVGSDGTTSLRSSGDNDCNRIARIFGGGGHKNAAGCRLTREQFKTIMSGGYADHKVV